MPSIQKRVRNSRFMFRNLSTAALRDRLGCYYFMCLMLSNGRQPALVEDGWQRQLDALPRGLNHINEDEVQRYLTSFEVGPGCNNIPEMVDWVRLVVGLERRLPQHPVRRRVLMKRFRRLHKEAEALLLLRPSESKPLRGLRYFDALIRKNYG